MKDNNIQSVFNKQRSDKFRLILTLPKILQGINNSDFSITQQQLLNCDSLQFSLYGATVPEISVPSKDIVHSGQTFRITSQARMAYEPVTCRFAIDNRFRNYWVLWKWLEVLNDPRTSGMDDNLSQSLNWPAKGQIPFSKNLWNYQTTITLMPLDEYNKKMCEFTFYNAFITKLSRMDFSYQTDEEIQGDFTFAFGQMDIKLEE